MTMYEVWLKRSTNGLRNFQNQRIVAYDGDSRSSIQTRILGKTSDGRSSIQKKLGEIVVGWNRMSTENLWFDGPQLSDGRFAPIMALLTAILHR